MLNGARERIDRRPYSSRLIEFISSIVITVIDHPSRFSILISLSSIIGLLLSFSPIRVHSPLIFARSSFPHQRAACADLPSPAQHRPTSLSNHAARSSQRSQRCLFTRPPLPPLFLFSPLLSLSPSLSLLARASRCSPRRSLSNLFAFASVWSKGP